MAWTHVSRQKREGRPGTCEAGLVRVLSWLLSASRFTFLAVDASGKEALLLLGSVSAKERTSCLDSKIYEMVLSLCELHVVGAPRRSQEEGSMAWRPLPLFPCFVPHALLPFMGRVVRRQYYASRLVPERARPRANNRLYALKIEHLQRRQ